MHPPPGTFSDYAPNVSLTQVLNRFQKEKNQFQESAKNAETTFKKLNTKSGYIFFCGQSDLYISCCPFVITISFLYHDISWYTMYHNISWYTFYHNNIMIKCYSYSTDGPYHDISWCTLLMINFVSATVSTLNHLYMIHLGS